MELLTIRKIAFSSKKDFQDRICKLWQDQKEDESYEFEFLDEESRLAYEDLISCFAIEGQQGASLDTA